MLKMPKAIRLRNTLNKFLGFLGFICSLSFLSCNLSEPKSSLKGGGNFVGNYRGVVKIEAVLTSRISAPKPESFLNGYLVESLRSQLGTYSTDRGNVVFENGNPNELNSMLWDLVLSNLAKDLSSICSGEEVSKDSRTMNTLNRIRPDISSIFLNICKWPEESVKNETTVLPLWLSLMGYDAPQSEYMAWRDYFLNANSPYSQISGEETLRAMIRSILLNPYFLLEQ
jgi:hypothetical protein